MKKYRVTLTGEEREQLQIVISKGKRSAQVIRRARILLKADEGDKKSGWIDEKIAESLDTSIPTVERVRKRFVLESLDAALYDRKKTGCPKTVMSGEVEAHLVALTCGKPPEGYARWTLKLLASRMVELSYAGHICSETVRTTLKKTNLSHG